MTINIFGWGEGGWLWAREGGGGGEGEVGIYMTSLVELLRRGGKGGGGEGEGGGRERGKRE